MVLNASDKARTKHLCNQLISQLGLCMFLPRCMECKRGLAMRILSVCPFVKRVDCDKTEERSV